jgi:hypothetical protein
MHHHSPLGDLKHAVNRDSALLGLVLGAQLNRLAALEAEQLRLARLQWWNSLSLEQRQVEIARAKEEEARREAQRAERRYQAKKREPLWRYRGSRVVWFVALSFGLLIMGAIVASTHGDAWGGFVIYLFTAVLFYEIPLRISARDRRLQRERDFERNYPRPDGSRPGATTHSQTPQRVPNLADERGSARQVEKLCPLPAKSALLPKAAKELSAGDGHEPDDEDYSSQASSEQDADMVDAPSDAGASTEKDEEASSVTSDPLSAAGRALAANTNKAVPDEQLLIEAMRAMRQYVTGPDVDVLGTELMEAIKRFLDAAKRLPEGGVRDEAARLAFAVANKVAAANGTRAERGWIG